LFVAKTHDGAAPVGLIKAVNGRLEGLEALFFIVCHVVYLLIRLFVDSFIGLFEGTKINKMFLTKTFCWIFLKKNFENDSAPLWSAGEKGIWKQAKVVHNEASVDGLRSILLQDNAFF
jgi:hypothetical protein